MRALVVEDDRGMAKLVRLLLEEEGFAVDSTASGEEGLTLVLENTYDVAVIDLGLPDRAGLTIVSESRARRRTTPLLILTGRASPADVVRGLDVGADDYLAKPFVNAVFKARVRALVRRGGAQRTESIACGPLLINRVTHEVLLDGRAVSLSPREHRLLEHLTLHAGRAVSRSDLLEHVWEMRFDPGTNLVDSLVARLRRKLRLAGPAPRIDTVPGYGYRLEAD
jgi:DNA-binding response OmpR family regulator